MAAPRAPASRFLPQPAHGHSLPPWALPQALCVARRMAARLADARGSSGESMRGADSLLPARADYRMPACACSCRRALGALRRRVRTLQRGTRALLTAGQQQR